MAPAYYNMRNALEAITSWKKKKDLIAEKSFILHVIQFLVYLRVC